MEQALCSCDLRDRLWDPNTGKCKRCGKTFKDGRKPKTHPENLALFAGLMHSLSIPVPSPGAGIEVTRALAAINKFMEENPASKINVGLDIYRDALTFVAGVWAYQQKLVIDQLEQAINNAPTGESDAVHA